MVLWAQLKIEKKAAEYHRIAEEKILKSIDEWGVM
jgi:hypothetical protein